MPNHQITIIYDADNPQATWAPRPDGSNRIVAQKGDTISFTFEGPGSVTDAVMMTGPRKKNADPSPFGGHTQINIKPDTEYKIGMTAGLWGFAITFATIGTDETVNFYFLPDPELEVGS
jgi:hypothetical protein